MKEIILTDKESARVTIEQIVKDKLEQKESKKEERIQALKEM